MRPSRHPAAATCPEARLSSPTAVREGRRILDLDAYTPYFLGSVNNALTRGAAQRYARSFGVGLTEWRVISMLAIEPRITANRICEVVSLDKAATSRALARLAAKGYTDFEAAASDPRRKLWWLNAAGYDLHARLIETALARERALIRGTDPADLEAFLRVMRLMRANVRAL